MKMNIQLEFTPNPETLKYSVSGTLIPSGAANFPTKESAEGRSPLALELFKDTRVSAVMIGSNFVTITVKDQSSLAELNEAIQKILSDFFESNQEAVVPLSSPPPKALTEIEKKIVEILEQEIRPAVAMDGGDISFEKYEDGFVFLKLQGSCSGCPSSMMTLKMGVETRLKQAIPEIQEVIPV
jgi:Fe-S cluster biogenesis protein NfuA